MINIKYLIFVGFVISSYYSCTVNHIVSTDKLYNFNVDIKAFGAKGDGKTDDTQAFKAAILEVSNSKAILVISPGEYIVKESIIIPKNATIKISGVNHEASIVKYKGNKVRSIIEYEGGGYLQISNIGITGNLQNEYAFYSDNITYSHFDKLRIFNCSQAAIGLGYGWCNTIRDCLVQNCYHGLELVKGECNGFKIEHCTFLNLKGVGIMFTATSNRAVSIDNCIFENIEQTGIFINASHNIDIDNCYFENVGFSGYLYENLKNKVKSSIIINGAGNARIAAHAYPTQGVSIKNCFIAPYETESFIHSSGVKNLKVELLSILEKDIYSILQIPENQSIASNASVIILGNIDEKYTKDLESRIKSKSVLNSETYQIK